MKKIMEFSKGIFIILDFFVTSYDKSSRIYVMNTRPLVHFIVTSMAAYEGKKVSYSEVI